MDSDYGIPRELSGLQKLRSTYQPELPPCLQGTTVRVEFGDTTTSLDPADAHAVSRAFPNTYGQPLAHFLRATAKVADAQIITEHPAMRVGLVFCGRQSPGGHNVIWGLHTALKIHNPKSTLLGFLGGSEGLFAQKTLEITDEILETYKNQGGYDLLGRTKDQIKTTEQVNSAMKACNDLKLDGLVIIGGVTSNTDAAQLAETFAIAKCPTKVVGVPVTLNGDLKNQFVETNVGYDTICKVNSQLISNMCTDALSAEKYYYFIRLMGRKASHVALECTLQSHPNMVILGEEVAASKLTLFDLAAQICDAVQARAEQDKNHGVILLPEGLIESIPEVYALLKEIHGLLRQGVSPDKISSQLSPWASALFEFMPLFIKKQLLLFPESDDSAQLSQIETEKLLAHLVETEMNKRLKEGTYKGKKFNAICHFFGYQARGSLPSKFDCDYAFVLGHICYHILAARLNGYMATITNLKNPVNKWRCGAAPITAMMTVKRWSQNPGASSIGKPAIHPATVDLKGKAYELLTQNARRFLIDDLYRNPGPLQFDGPGADTKAISLCVEDQDYMGRIKKLQQYLDQVRTIVETVGGKLATSLTSISMSLNSFKETLRPCKSSSSSSPSSFTLQSDPPANPRKPPKSSLSQQLLRLQEPISPPPIQPQTKKKQTHVDHLLEEEEEEEGEEDGLREATGRPKLGKFQFDHTGPFEPLILSSPDEVSVVQVPASINCRLLEHQRVGVKFLYTLYKNNHGGILGDDMGLGKTIQTIAFLAAIFGKDGEGSIIDKDNQMEKKGHVLIICPTSVIHNWEDEFSRWASFTVSCYHGANRELILEKLKAREVEVLITSFDTYRIHGNILSGVQWEVVIVDEAHRLKNEKSKLYIACLEIQTRKRIGLTGTIMQNKIMELFNLFDWVSPGSLGTREHFREYYDDPLKHGQRSTAPERFVRIADERKQHLVSVLRKYMLRRTKEETIGHLMMGKEDNVVFCAMSELQKRAYTRMLQLPDIQCLINKELPCSCGSPLTQVECCKRIVPDGIIWSYLHRDNPEGCDSCPFCIVLPCLVKLQQISNHLELIKPNPRDEPDKQRKDAEFSSAVFGPDIDLVGGNTASESFMGLSDAKHCGKMRVLEKLMLSWSSQGDKVLLFSYSVRMLDILEKFLIRKGYCFSRLDGSTPSNVRQSLVDDFNSSPSKQVFLISTRAGGLGLNLVSANRVVIFDPNWTPAQDLQAQDRSFRFGQKRHVVVFRLLAAGSLEELIYSRQVYKQQLSNIAVSGKMEKRYFEGVQDCKEFQGELFGICNLFRDLSDKLFTSEIIELHEEQGQEHKPHGKKQDLSKLGTHFAPTLESLDSETRNPSDRPEATTSKPVLEELGILYAHRYEDVVNFKSDTHGTMEAGVSQSDITMHPLVTVPRRRLEGMSGKENALSSSNDQKRIQFGRLARFMGMEEIEFSKWLLSATPARRERVLRDYKRRKEKKPSNSRKVHKETAS